MNTNKSSCRIGGKQSRTWVNQAEIEQSPPGSASTSIDNSLTEVIFNILNALRYNTRISFVSTLPWGLLPPHMSLILGGSFKTEFISHELMEFGFWQHCKREVGGRLAGLIFNEHTTMHYARGGSSGMNTTSLLIFHNDTLLLLCTTQPSGNTAKFHDTLTTLS
ncbi:hypothetical protein NPIL_698451 [Nephila pilipes]|uniref:Uncharacterized protein n=1 Tax=Nephila pilipes TaxID=299642 RepID=A0A8X6UF07_NEPPI|nr:hypothetical protein NPIL_698451 [Nephila pilipes]